MLYWGFLQDSRHQRAVHLLILIVVLNSIAEPILGFSQLESSLSDMFRSGVIADFTDADWPPRQSDSQRVGRAVITIGASALAIPRFAREKNSQRNAPTTTSQRSQGSPNRHVTYPSRQDRWQ